MCLFDGILVPRANLNNRCKRSERRVAIGIVVRLFGTTDGVRDPAELVTNSAGSRTPLLGGASGRDLPRPAGQWQSSGHWKIIGKHGRLLWIFKYSQELGNSNNCRGDWPPCVHQHRAHRSPLALVSKRWERRRRCRSIDRSTNRSTTMLMLTVRSDY